jgi:hypothetical protein
LINALPSCSAPMTMRFSAVPFTELGGASDSL